MINNIPTIIRLRNTLEFVPNDKYLIYVERDYNPEANDFLMKYIAKDRRLLFLPQITEKIIQEEETLEYANPGHIELNKSEIYNVIFDYVDNIDLITNGFIHFTGYKDEEWYYYSYTQYEGLSEELMFAQFSDVEFRDKKWALSIEGKERLAVGSGVRFCIHTDPVDHSSADETFDWESKNLIKEIEERVAKLEQKGIARAVLMKMIGGETKPSRMIIDSKYRIYLIDYGYMEIKMTPLVTAVYFLFLNHPEGIMFKELGNYKSELMQIYSKISNRSDMADMAKSISSICDPLNNSINEKCARIREAFIAKFDRSIVDYYCITGRRGEAKNIKLDRSMVIGKDQLIDK